MVDVDDGGDAVKDSVCEVVEPVMLFLLVEAGVCVTLVVEDALLVDRVGLVEVTTVAVDWVDWLSSRPAI